MNWEFSRLEDYTKAQKIASRNIIQFLCTLIVTSCCFMSDSSFSNPFSECPKEIYIVQSTNCAVCSWPIDTTSRLEQKRIKLFNPNLLLILSGPPKAPQQPRNGNEHLDHFPKECHKGSLWHCKGQGFRGKIPQQEEFGLTLVIPT